MVRAHGGRQAAIDKHVGKVELAAGLERRKDGREHGRLVGRQVDHAVRDGHVDRRRLDARRAGEVLDEALRPTKCDERDVVSNTHFCSNSYHF